MIELFVKTGPFAWPQLIMAAAIAILVVRKTAALFGREASVETERGLNAIIFWVGISLLTGFLGHYAGIYGAMLAVARAGDVSAAVMAGGYAESLLTILWGLLIFLFSALAWFVLRWRYGKLD